MHVSDVTASSGNLVLRCVIGLYWICNLSHGPVETLEYNIHLSGVEPRGR
jgi:hypothetical protein